MTVQNFVYTLIGLGFDVIYVWTKALWICWILFNWWNFLALNMILTGFDADFWFNEGLLFTRIMLQMLIYIVCIVICSIKICSRNPLPRWNMYWILQYTGNLTLVVPSLYGVLQKLLVKINNALIWNKAIYNCGMISWFVCINSWVIDFRTSQNTICTSKVECTNHSLYAIDFCTPLLEHRS